MLVEGGMFGKQNRCGVCKEEHAQRNTGPDDE